MNKEYNIIFCGVGGLGVLSANTVLGETVLLEHGDSIEILLSETHGMAQRGGSITCSLRAGQVYSPLVPEGSADVICSLELQEAIRPEILKYAKGDKKTCFLINDFKLAPPRSTRSYPKKQDVITELKRFSEEVYLVDAKGLATRKGIKKASNMAMLGFLIGAKKAPVKLESLEAAITNTMKQPQENIEIAKEGYGLGKKNKKELRSLGLLV